MNDRIATHQRLNRIPWDQLAHAYGPASDVPDLLRGLRSVDAKVRKEALWELYGTIFHQGTRYTATPYAVPFLYELVQDPATPDRDKIISLLANLALGYEESYLPRGLEAARFRTELAAAEASLSPEERAECARYGYSPGVDLACYDAVRVGVPILHELLGDEDDAVRQAAAYALAWFPEDALQTLPRLNALLAASQEPTLLATAILSTGLLLQTAPAPVGSDLRPFLAHPALPVRVAAAIALIAQSPNDQVIATLTAGIATPDELDQASAGIRFNEGSLAGYASLALAVYGAAHRQQIVPALCQALAGVTPYAALSITEALLHAAFPAGVPADGLLDQEQIQALAAIVAHGGWRIDGGVFVNYTEVLRAHGLPDNPAALQAYLSARSSSSWRTGPSPSRAARRRSPPGR